MKRQQDDQRVFVNVIVECTEKLGAEKRQKPPLTQQAKLTLL